MIRRSSMTGLVVMSSLKDQAAVGLLSLPEVGVC